MVNIRELTGGNHIVFDIGTNGMDEVLFGAFTFVAIVKRLSGHTEQGALLDIANGLGGSRGFFRYTDNASGNNLNYLRGQFDSPGDSSFTFTPSDGWCCIAFTKADGTNVVRYHKGIKSSGSTSWTHADSSGTVDDDDNTCDRIQTRFVEDNDYSARIRVAAYVFYTSVLNDATLESIDSSYQDMLGQNPIWAVKFDQASTSTAVTDDVGDADQSSLVGSSVITNDDPPNWTYSSEQTINLPFHQQVNSIFTPTIQNQSPLDANLSLINSTEQFFVPTLENQSPLDANLSLISAITQLFAPTLTIGSQTVELSFIPSTAQIFAAGVANQSPHDLNLPLISSTAQLFTPTLTANALDLDIHFVVPSSLVIFTPIVFVEGSELFEPTLVGNGSLADQILAGLIDQGFLTGSLADRERARLLAKLAISDPQPLTLQDLYSLANEDNRLAGLEATV